MPKENKTADKKEYQKEYMKNYIANAESITCPICGGSFRTYNKYKHDKTDKHLHALLEIKDKEEKAELKKKEEELQQKALAEEQAKRNKPVPAPRKKKAEPTPTENPIPAPRKKKEAAKSESLKMLEEYGSSSEEEADKEPTKTKEVSFVLQTKKIDSEKVAEFLKEQFEASVNPARKADNKTPRLNKNASLWRKVSKELDGKTFKELGMNFGKIVTTAYDKPNSQGDFAQMLKQVILHFTKVPTPVEDKIKEYIRNLKQKQIEKST